MPENEACQFCEKPCDPRGLKAHERACDKNPTNMEVPPGTSDDAETQLEATPIEEEKPRAKPVNDPRREMVNVILYPAYKSAAEYCRSEGIVYESQVERKTKNGPVTVTRMRTSVSTQIQRGDYEALQTQQKGCVRLA